MKKKLNIGKKYLLKEIKDGITERNKITEDTDILIFTQFLKLFYLK